jgi:hypothetical protein
MDADLQQLRLIDAFLEDGTASLAEDAFDAEVEQAVIGSGLIGHNQKMTVAASATAEKKTVGQRS